jgi:uncharacterized protein YkwD
LKKLFVAMIFFLALLFISLTYNDFLKDPNNFVQDENPKHIDTSEHNKNDDKQADTYKESVHQYLQMSEDDIIEKFGEPDRKDPSAYGYVWWVYSQTASDYIQFGIADSNVVSIYAIGDQLNVEPFRIGASSSEIFSKIPLESTVSLNYNEGSFRFELSEEEMVVRPLVAVDDVWAQLYFDKYTQKLSSIRYIIPEYLIIQRPYAMVYRGELIDPLELSDQEWKEVEQGEQKQILDLTNIIRGRHQVQPVEWHEKAAEVAYGHSKEMFEKDYFSHTSPVSGDLADRLMNAGVLYSQAGENIAANYIDAPATVEGWLNSEGHRKTMLNEDYTHLGIGVFHKHYTQNFIIPWDKE